MSDHEFERQVRQKLNHLKMDPSAKAWENIEEELRDRKRRRFPFLFIPMLAIGLAVGGFVLYQYGFDKSVITKAVADKIIPARKLTPIPASKRSIDHQSSSPITYQKKTFAEQKKSTQPVSESNAVANDETVIVNTEEIKDEITAEIQHQLPNKNVSSNKFLSAVSPRYESVNTDNSAAIKEVIQHKPSKWSFGVSGFAGTSFVNNGSLLNFDQAKVEDVSANRNVPTFTNAYTPPPTPSVVSPGFSFSAGAVAKRELSKRFSITAGLSYTQMNTLSRVGPKINAAQVVNTGVGYLSVQNYYLLEESQNYVYKNRYHFIELPVSVYYRVNNKGKLPIYLNGGFVVAQLLQSTSLHFDGTTGVYYKNDRLINQTQAAASAGITFALLPKSKRPLWIGPTVRSNISSILEKEVSENKHFMSVGVDLKYFIK